MAGDAVVVGSGAAGSVVAWELARCGWTVTVLERGRNLRPGLGEVDSGDLGTEYGSDEVKQLRQFGFPDPVLEPYTTRTQAQARDGVARAASGAFGQLGAAVGGTTLHYNAKTPRFWKQDFSQLSDLGPVEGTQVADWPISYDELAPYYDEVERRVGVQGDVEAMPARSLAQAPRTGQFVMPPNPTPLAARLLAEGASRLGMTAFPYPAAVNSTDYDGRPPCVSCGLCSGFGCAINARGDALVSWLNPALRTGRVRVVERAFVHRVETTADGRRATRVLYRGLDGHERAVSGDVVVLAGSPINTARLLLLSSSGAHPAGLGNRSDQVGRNLMLHNFTQAAAFFAEDIKPLRSQSTTLEIDDLVGPFTGPEVQALGVPYVKGGLVQVGGAVPLVMEAQVLAGFTGFGQLHKSLMRFGPLHARGSASQLVHEDLPQAQNRVDLDPQVRDFLGTPAARITYSPHRHEQVAALLLGAQVEAYSALAPGALGAAALPFPLISDAATYTAHLAGTARMGTDPAASVCAADGRLHDVENVYVADASTFPTFPGFNPTLTVMANALRIARTLACGTAPAGGEPATAGGRLPSTGGPAALPLVALAAGAAAAGCRRLPHDPEEDRT
ncbi:MAG TPA: GMC family oxidoreductase [Mycobacteriales bacterium]|nr:GMC family oxidoreductase [Mycobacteriales bacterium]